MRPNCTLVWGDATGVQEEEVANNLTAQECIDFVTTKEPTANGITWVITGECWAEFGATYIGLDGCYEKCRTCLFDGRLIWLHILITSHTII